MSSAAQLRADLAAAIGAALSGYAVYPAPPDVMAAPAVVIAPRAAYRTRTDYCREEVRLNVMILVPRAAGPAGMEVLDSVSDQVRDAIETVPDCTWQTVESVGNVQEVGGAEYLMATFSVIGYVEGNP